VRSFAPLRSLLCLLRAVARRCPPPLRLVCAMSTSVASTFLCSLSGSVPVEPVVARTSGLLFERRLIERALELNGNVCPRTGAALTKEELLPVRTALAAGAAAAGGVAANEVVRPRPASATSLPGLLALMQSEWDAIVLESFQLKQALEATKQDLAHALYKEDAANRVIARLLTERDQARHALLQTEANVGAAKAASNGAAQAASTPMDVDDGKKAAATPAGELPEAVLTTITNTAATLQKSRKATVKEAAAAVATPAQLQALTVGERSHALHSTTNQGILALDLSRTNADLVLTGGNDGQALLFNKATGKIAATLKGHKSAVTCVKFHPTRDDLLFSGSLDHTVNVWKNDQGGGGKFNVAHHLTGARDAVTGLSIHASGDYAAASSKDGSWALYDVNAGTELKRMAGSSALTTISFHPDGLLLSAGSVDGHVRLFDVKSWKLAVSLPSAHSTSVSSLVFAENGFQCATAEVGGVIKLWDLRSVKVAHTWTPAAVETDKAGKVVSCLAFDSSASYLAASVGSRVEVYSNKKDAYDLIATFAEHKDRVTAIAWGEKAQTCVTVGIDRQLKVWA
jgi:pre-mRNA-processing factor 19